MEKYCILVAALFIMILRVSGDRRLSLHGNSTSNCIAEELKALLEFKKALRPIHWDGVQNRVHGFLAWNDTRCCQWNGISCDDKGHVTKLEVPGDDVPARQDATSTTYTVNTSLIEIFGPLLKLRHLNHLDLTGIYCSDCMITPVLGSMKELIFLGLPYGLSGMIPPSLGNLTRLRVLIVPPSFGLQLAPTVIGWLSRLASLTDLEMSFVNFPKTVDMAQVLSWFPSLNNLALISCGLDNSFLGNGVSNSTLSSGFTHLDLSSNSFSGMIPEGLQNLTSLEVLDLSGNAFNSSIPVWFANLGNLVDLFLEYNSLDSIDGGLGWLLGSKRDLRSLQLSFNRLTRGVFTSENVSISVLYGHDLEYLDLSNNNIEDALPDWLDNLKALKTLRLQSNKLSGDVFGWLHELSALEWLDLSQNQLSGGIPPSIGGLKRLRVLDLHENGLNGTVAEALGRLSNLESLDLSRNSLKGVILEAHFQGLSKLNFLDIGGNHLTVLLDNFRMPPFRLRTIRMGSCLVGKRFPGWVRSQEEALELDLSDASISDVLPEWLGEMKIGYLNLSWNDISGPLPDLPKGLVSVDLSHNSISGPLPESIGGMSLLKCIYAIDSKIGGSIPSSIGNMKSLAELVLTNNNITGSIPSSLCNVKTLLELDLAKNKLAESIPNCWDGRLERMDLSFNKLSGSIPSSLGRLFMLYSLHLNNNQLMGELPSGLSRCGDLFYLDLGENNLEGNIPMWIGGESLPWLNILRLRENNFHGWIHPQLCSFQLLQVLDLAGNQLEGTIPPCFGNMTGFNRNRDDINPVGPVVPPLMLRHEPATWGSFTGWNREHMAQVMKGREDNYTITILQLFTNIDLSRNNLVGMIPQELTFLFGLQGMNLSLNRLIGRIPRTIGHMNDLESLDLSGNLLSGEIPPSISALTSLSHLNLSHNNFSGELPKGRQMQTLNDPSMYAGNPLLCADFLPRKCHFRAPPPLPGHQGGQDVVEDRLEKLLFYAVTVLGFACGFWGVVGSLILNKDWRLAYFAFAERVTDGAYAAVTEKMAGLKSWVRSSS